MPVLPHVKRTFYPSVTPPRLLVDDKIFEALHHCQCVNDIFAHVLQNPYALNKKVKEFSVNVVQ